MFSYIYRMFACMHARSDLKDFAQKAHILSFFEKHKGKNLLYLSFIHAFEVNHTDRDSTPINFYRPITPYSSLSPKTS